MERPLGGSYREVLKDMAAQSEEHIKALQQTREEFEAAKKKMRDDRIRGSKRIDDKFSGSDKASGAESTFRERTVGLVSAMDFKRFKEEADVVAGGGGWVGGGGAPGCARRPAGAA